MIYPLYDNLKPLYLRILYGHPVDRKKRLLISLFTVVSSDWTRVKTSFWFQMMWNFLSKTHVVPSGLLESLRMINMKNFRTVKNSVDAYLPPKYLQTVKWYCTFCKVWAINTNTVDYEVVLSQNISQGQSILERLLCCFYRGSAYQTSFVWLSIKILVILFLTKLKIHHWQLLLSSIFLFC